MRLVKEVKARPPAGSSPFLFTFGKREELVELSCRIVLRLDFLQSGDVRAVYRFERFVAKGEIDVAVSSVSGLDILDRRSEKSGGNRR